MRGGKVGKKTASKANTNRSKKAHSAAPELKLLRATKIPDTGEKGFEGLVARLLEALVDKPFRVVRSGSQRGRDAESNTLFVECKYYDAHNALPIADVKHKITEAAEDHPELDLWVLVTTTTVDANLAAAIRSTGCIAGIGTLVLDGATISPYSFPALLAASPRTTRDFFTTFHPRKRVDALLRAIANRAKGPKAAERKAKLVAQLQSGFLGQAHLREGAAHFYRSLLDSKAAFFEKFGQDITKQQLTKQFVRRNALDHDLDRWLSAPLRPAVVLGDEGVGKTTAVLEWFVRRMGSPTHICLFSTASHLDAVDLPSAIVQILSEVFAGASQDVWRRRLARWLSSAGAPILLVVDGLNERRTVPWPRWLAWPIDMPSAQLALLVTSWPTYWEEAIKPRLPQALATTEGNVERIREVALCAFDAIERDRLLQCWGRALDDFPHEARDALFHPRIGAMLCRHYDELKEAGDFTPARIIFQSYRDRASKGDALTAQQFNSLIRNLVATNPAGRLSDGDIRPIVRDLFGQELEDAIVAEVTQSGVFAKIDDTTGSLIVDPNRIRYGLGLVLLTDCVSARGTASEVADWLAQRVAEDGGLPYQLHVVASAFYHATQRDVEPHVISAIAFVLLGYRQFLSDGVLSLFVSTCLRKRPSIAGELAQLLFMKGSIHGTNEWLGAILIASRSDPGSRPEVDRWLTRWVSFYHEEGLWPFPNEREERVAEVRARVVELAQIAKLPKPPAHTAIEAAASPEMLRLTRFALYVASAGPRSTLLPAMGSWAVSRALMDGLVEQDEMQWIVRLTDEAVAEPVIAMARSWEATKTRLGARVARFLLRLPATQASDQEIAMLPPPQKSEISLKFERERAANPCMYSTPWDDDLCRRCLGKKTTSLRLALAGLVIRRFDPSLKLARHIVAKARDSALALDPNELYTARGRTTADGNLEDATSILIVAAPASIADIAHRLVSSTSLRSNTPLRQLAIHLSNLSPLFNATDLKQLRARLEVLWKMPEWVNEKSQISDDLKVTESYLVDAMLPHWSGRKQLDFLLERPAGSWNLLKWERVFRALTTTDEALVIRQLLKETSPKRLETLLWVAARPQVAMPDSLAQRIAEWTQSQAIGLRHAATRFAYFAHSRTLDELVRERVLASGPIPVEVTPSAQYASYVIARDATVPLKDLLPSIVPGLLSRLIEQRGMTTADLGWLRVQLELLLFSPGNDDVEKTTDVRVKWPDRDVDVANFDVELPQPPTALRNEAVSWREPEEGLNPFFSDLDSSSSRSQAIDQIRTVWKSLGGQLYGWPISANVLNALFRSESGLAEQWVGRLCRDRHFPAAPRWSLLYTLLLAIDRALWDVSSDLACRIWTRLWDAGMDRKALSEHAFCAADSTEAIACRNRALDACESDNDLFNIVECSEIHGRTQWLSDTIDAGLAAVPLWRKARALTLVAFRSADAAEFDACLARTDISRTWVESCVPGLRRAFQCDHWARTWFAKGLSAKDKTKAWGAFAALSHIVDARFERWGLDSTNLTPRARVILRAHGDEIKHRIEAVEKERSSTLYSLKKEQDELAYVPYLEPAHTNA